jgi:4-amino-4-deoxy-L-arabinose transferase-like glycosyltransferase
MNELEKQRRSSVGQVELWVALLIPLLVGFLLRLRYALTAEPFVDEPTTLLVAQAIARQGLPLLPSGLFYGNDLPFSYLAGGLVALSGPSLTVLRLFSLAASVATIGLVYDAGRRWFSPWTGLWAALLLALSPEAILWGGRARAYALLDLLTFLSVWLFYGGLVAERPVRRRLGLALLVVAVFVHPEAALLLPALAIGAALLQGWRWWLRRGRWVELILAAIGVLSRYGLQVALARGLIGGFATMTGSRLPLELATDWAARVQEMAPFFVDSGRLPWTILALVALAVAVWSAVGSRFCRGSSVPAQQRPNAGTEPVQDPSLRAQRSNLPLHRPALFFSVCLWLVPLQMLAFLGDTYQSPRYLSLLLPILSLLAGAGLDWLVSRLTGLGWLCGLLPGKDGGKQWALGVAAALALLAASLPGALAASNTTEKGFSTALKYVQQHWQPGDRVATVAPAYSQFVLNRNDFFALGREYEEFVYRDQDGRWVDRWLGSPLLSSPADLEAALQGPGRLWFVIDEGRLRTRFDAALVQMVWDRMALVANDDQAMVFVSREVPAPATSHAVGATFGDQLALVGYDLGLADQRPASPGWGEVVVHPGQALPLMLRWQAVAPVTGNYTLFIHLIGPDGERAAQQDGPPLGGLQPTTHWLTGEMLPDTWTLDLPADLKPGRYRIDVGLYEPNADSRLPVSDPAGHAQGEALVLDYVRVLSQDEALPAPLHKVEADFAGDGDRIRLVGYTLANDRAAPGGTLAVTLYWQAVAPVAADYTVLLHLLDDDDQIQGQGDGLPVGGYYPTSFWDPGELIVDEHLVTVDAEAEAGDYRLATGLYLLPSGQRLSAPEGDRVLLGEVQVGR